MCKNNLGLFILLCLLPFFPFSFFSIIFLWHRLPILDLLKLTNQSVVLSLINIIFKRHRAENGLLIKKYLFGLSLFFCSDHLNCFPLTLKPVSFSTLGVLSQGIIHILGKCHGQSYIH